MVNQIERLAQLTRLAGTESQGKDTSRELDVAAKLPVPRNLHRVCWAICVIAVFRLAVPLPMHAATGGKQSMNSFVNDLMSKMTLEEKIGQMNMLSIGFDVTGPVISEAVDEKIKKGLVGAVLNTYTPTAVRKLQQMAVSESRLKIPLLFGFDVIHGHRTIFPIPLGLSSSWNLALIERTASVAAEEASADGVNWTFSPMVDIARDPRWGRVSEGAGEDPYLGSLIARAMVRGYQGSGYANTNKVLSCIKHFALYGATEAGRDYNTVDMSPLRMYNEYFPPYRAGIDAGADTVMTSFNEVNGVPVTGNKWLVTDILRDKWRFSGLVVTDYTAIIEMVAHGVGDEKHVSELALNAGIDMDMVSELFVKYGAELVRTGKVPASQIDSACRRVLEAKYKLGLFDNPFRFASEANNKQSMSADKLQLSRQAAAESMVLLKNAGQLLPLEPGKKIAFIGPLVKDQRNLIGNWSGAGEWQRAISVWDALGSAFKGHEFLYAKGCNLVEDSGLRDKLNQHGGELTLDASSPEKLIEEAVRTARESDVVVAVLGEPFGMSGEAACRSQIGLLDNQVKLLNAIKATGKPIVLVLMNGRPLTLSREDENMDAILETWYGGTMAGAAIVDVLFGGVNPSGRLTMTFPRNVGQIPIYYNAKNTGRPFDEKDKFRSKYLDVPNSPLYPFGFGLSYTTYSFGEVSADRAVIKPGEVLTVETKVTNTGKREGTETVQLYIQDVVGSITRPVKELKGFQQVSLKPGETKAVVFRITEEDLRFFNSNLEYKSEPGEFRVLVGPNSAQVKSVNFNLN